MQKSSVKFAAAEEPTLLVWRVPREFREHMEDAQIFVLPVLSRDGALLIALPLGVLSSEILLDANLLEDDQILGPSKEFSAELLEEQDSGPPRRVGVNCTFVVVDVQEAILAQCREYDPVTDSTDSIIPFASARPSDLPEVRDALVEITAWITSVNDGRLHFYSAREEPGPVSSAKKAAPKRVTTTQIAQQLAALSARVQLLSAQQDAMKETKAKAGQLDTSAIPAGEPVLGVFPTSKIPALSSQLGPSGPQAVSKVATLVGPPPKVRQSLNSPAVVVDPPGELGSLPQPEAEKDMTSIVSALSQQSLAITQLVSHLTSGDAMTELQGGFSSASSTSTKGVARREKMQAELAARTSSYFLQVEQQLFKRMCPARVVPTNVEEIQTAGVSMTAYMERYGGFKGQRENGLAAWIAGHAMDAAASGDFGLTKEYLAILVACLEQATMDGGWSVAYVLSLLEEPPSQVFAERMQSQGITRPFAPLVPPNWAATALSYLKEVELLQSKKSEVRPRGQPAKSSTDLPDAPSPKRRPKFPKKPAAPPPEGQK